MLTMALRCPRYCTPSSWYVPFVFPTVSALDMMRTDIVLSVLEGINVAVVLFVRRNSCSRWCCGVVALPGVDAIVSCLLLMLL